MQIIIGILLLYILCVLSSALLYKWLSWGNVSWWESIKIYIFGYAAAGLFIFIIYLITSYYLI